MKSIAVIGAVIGLVICSPYAALAQTKPGMPGHRAGGTGQSTVNLRVCNRSGRDASVAVSYIETGSNRFVNRGWYDVNNGACTSLVSTDNANFYFYADARDNSGNRWEGSHTLCVQYPGPYTFYSNGETECGSNQELRGFVPAHAENPGDYTWNLDP